jgi:hypothetical protein
MSDKPISADNQQERFPIFNERFKWWLSGFVDGEGSFCLSLKRKPDCTFGWQIDPSFYLYQHEKHLWVLEDVKKFFGGGCIHRKSNPGTVFTYALHGIVHAKTKVIPFFSTYPPRAKHETFRLFTEAVELMEQKIHHERIGFEKIVRIAYRMNQMGKGRKWTLDRVLGKSSETVRQTHAPLCIEMIQSDLPGDRKSMTEMFMSPR